MHPVAPISWQPQVHLQVKCPSLDEVSCVPVRNSLVLHEILEQAIGISEKQQVTGYLVRLRLKVKHKLVVIACVEMLN